jgi:hypothetical protein
MCAIDIAGAFVAPNAITNIVLQLGRRSGRGHLVFEWEPIAGDYFVDVVVTGEISGSRWTYTIACPSQG